jgi:hypothetical protein
MTIRKKVAEVSNTSTRALLVALSLTCASLGITMAAATDEGTSSKPAKNIELAAAGTQDAMKKRTEQAGSSMQKGLRRVNQDAGAEN